MSVTKLRAWDKVLNKMLYSKQEQMDDSLLYRFDQHFEDDSPEYMESTGINDSNNKEMFKRDIFQIRDSKGEIHLFEVVFEDGCYYGKHIEGNRCPIFTVVQYAFGEYIHEEYAIDGDEELLHVFKQFMEEDTLEIVGSTYENPYLLKAGASE